MLGLFSFGSVVNNATNKHSFKFGYECVFSFAFIIHPGVELQGHMVERISVTKKKVEEIEETMYKC